MTITLKDARGQIWEFDNEREARQAVRLGMSEATPEDIKYEQERQFYESPTGKALAVGAGLQSIGTLGASDVALERALPGITRNTDKFSPLIRGGTELAALLAGTMATGGAAGAARLSAATAPQAGVGFAQKATNPALKHAFKMGGMSARVGDIAARAAASPTARMVGQEALMGAALGHQQGFKQSAIEGADLEKAASNVLSSVVAGAALGAGTGLLVGTTLNQFRKFRNQSKKQIAAGFEANGIPAGQASKMADVTADAIENELKSAPGQHRTVPLYSHLKGHPDIQRGLRNIIFEKGEVAQGKLVSDLYEKITNFQNSSKFLDEIAYSPNKDKIGAVFAANPKPGSREFLEIDQSVQAISEELAGLKNYVRKNIVGKHKDAKQIGKFVERLRNQFEDYFISRMEGGGEARKFVKSKAQVLAESISKATTGNPANFQNYMGVAQIINLDAFKRSMFAGETILKNVSGQKKYVTETAQSIYGNIKKTLETPDVVGATFAKFQKEFNAGTTEVIGLGGSKAPFAKEWLPRIPRGKDPDSKNWKPSQNPAKEKIERFVKNLDDQSEASNFSRESLFRYIDDQATRARAIIDVANKYEKLPGIDSKVLESARQTIKLRDEITKALDPSIKGSTVGDVMAYNYFKAAKQFDSESRNVREGLMSATMGAGYALGAPGFMLYQAVRGIGAMGNMSQAPARSFEAIGSLYLRSKAKDGVVSRGMDKMFARRIKAPGVVKKKRAGKRPSYKYGLAYLGAEQIRYEKSLEEYRKQFANPSEAQKKVLDALLPLGSDFNDLRSLAVAKDTQIRNYMLQFAPTAAINPYMVGRPRPPSKVEAERYNRIDFILRNPERAATRLAERKLTVEEVDGLKVIWPQIFQDMQLDAMQRVVELRDKGETLPWPDRIQLGTLLEIPTDPLLDFRFIQERQLGYAQEKKRSVSPPPQRQKASKRAESYQSESQKTELGEYQ